MSQKVARGNFWASTGIMVDGYQPLTDSQWQIIELLLPTQRRRRSSLRHVFNALLYVCRTGCQWRALPAQFPPWAAVYYYFYRWQRLGLWQQLNPVVNALDRVAHDRKPTPALACLDSQRVKPAPRICEHRGLDAHKLVNSRKHQLLVDFLLARTCDAHMHAVHRHDSTGALALLPYRPWWARRLQLVLTDAAYRGRFAQQLLRWGPGPTNQ